MSISNTLQQVGFTSGDDLLYGTLRSLNLQVKNTCKGGKNTLQQVVFTSGDLLYGTSRSLNLQVKNTCKGGKVFYFIFADDSQFD